MQLIPSTEAERNRSQREAIQTCFFSPGVVAATGADFRQDEYSKAGYDTGIGLSGIAREVQWPALRSAVKGMSTGNLRGLSAFSGYAALNRRLQTMSIVGETAHRLLSNVSPGPRFKI